MLYLNNVNYWYARAIYGAVNRTVYGYRFPLYPFRTVAIRVILTVWSAGELLRHAVLCGNVFVLLITNPEE